MWPFGRKRDQGEGRQEKHQDRHDLYGLELDEVSVVDAGDNPGAHLVLWKSAGGQGGNPPAPAQQGTDDAHLERMVDEIIQEELAGDAGATTTGKGLMTTTLSKRGDVLAAHATVTEQLRKQQPELTEAAARMQAWQQRPDLAQRYSELPAEPVVQQAPVVKGQQVLQKHATAVEELRKAHPNSSEAELRQLAWAQNPQLQREYQQALGY